MTDTEQRLTAVEKKLDQLTELVERLIALMEKKQHP